MRTTDQSVLRKQLPKIQQVPLEKIRRKLTRFSCRDTVLFPPAKVEKPVLLRGWDRELRKILLQS